MNDSKNRGTVDRDAGYEPTSDTPVTTPLIPAELQSSTKAGMNLSRKFPKPTSDSILVCPLGGVGQIGMNWTLYGFAGKWILIDAGSMFAKDVPGIGGIFPDPRTLAPILDDLVGLLVTHAHEDHIGAIAHLASKIRVPIHATPFAAEILKARLLEKGFQVTERSETSRDRAYSSRPHRRKGRHGNSHDEGHPRDSVDPKGHARDTRRSGAQAQVVELRIFNPGDTIKTGPFVVRSASITHSTAECVGFAVGTKAGTIMHTGDWKLDPNPLVGEVTDEKAFREIGRNGVLAILSDSTNAEKEARITSEAEVAENLAHVFAKKRGIVVVSCFATNVARLEAIGRAAAASGRKVAFAGRSLEKVDAAARTLNLIDQNLPFLEDAKHLKGLDRHEIVIVCTGTQGEERAALAKLARGENWRLPKLQPGDTVIHSARTIPGNEEPVEKMMTMFREDGIEVLMGEEDGKVLHVTGHASRGEMRTMYDWIKPKFAIPVHGGASQLNAHAQLARDCGVQEAILTEEGDVLRVTRRTVQKIAHVNVRHLAIQEGPKETLISWDKAGNQPMKLKQVNSQRKNQSRKEQSQAKPSSRPPRSRRHPRDHAPAIAA